MVADDKIERLASKLVTEFDPKKIILFGSYAWGQPTADSDIDLLVVVQPSVQSRRERQLAMRLALADEAMPVDILTYTPAELRDGLGQGSHFLKEVLNKGKVLYG